MQNKQNRMICCGGVFALALACLSLWAADAGKPVKPSSYAPAKDVAAQINLYVQQISTDLANENEYSEEHQGRVAKDANTIVVLAQVLAHHDEEHPLKTAAPAMLQAAKQVGENAGEFAAAKKALTELQQSLEAKAAGGAAKWEPVADLAQLMKQVPIVNNKLRAGVTGRRFEKTIEQSAGNAVTLAAIAEASKYDTAYCSGAEEEAKWVKICEEMRDAAAEVHSSVLKKDKGAATAGLAKLVKTCDDCHHTFRD